MTFQQGSCATGQMVETPRWRCPNFTSSRSRRLWKPKARWGPISGPITNEYPFQTWVRQVLRDQTRTDTPGNGCWLYIQIFLTVLYKVQWDYGGGKVYFIKWIHPKHAILLLHNFAQGLLLSQQSSSKTSSGARSPTNEAYTMGPGLPVISPPY